MDTLADNGRAVKSRIMSPFTTSKQSAHYLDQYAQQHGTTAAAYIAAGWSPDVVERRGRPALVFATKSGRRYRFVDGDKPKYDQDPGYTPCWYGLNRAVKFDLDIIVDCNGAPSTVPAQAYGIPAFSLQAGETTSPSPELISELKQLWQGRILVAFDCDHDGRAGAIKRVQLYRANGFDAEAVDLGLDTPGADLADYLMQHGETGLGDLRSAPRLDIPPVQPEPKQARPAIYYAEGDKVDMTRLALDALHVWRRDIYYAWVEVGMALTELGEVGLSLWDAWSAGSDKYKPGACAKKWRTFKGPDGITLGTLFYYADTDYGPGWRPYKPLPSADNLTPSPSPNYGEGYPTSLPIAVRGAINTYADPSVAALLDLWLEGIKIGALEPGEASTVKCLVHIANLTRRGMSERVIRSAIKRATDPHGGQFLTSLPYSIRSREEDSIGPESESGKSVRNPCKHVGRDPDLYELASWQTILTALARLAVAPILQKAFPADDDTVAPIRAEFLADLGRPDAERLAEQLNTRYAAVLAAQPGYKAALEQARKDYTRLLWSLSNPQTAPIPDGWTYKNASEYVACCARAIVEAAGGATQYGKARLCAMIGCSPRNLKTVLTRAGVWVSKEDTTVDCPARNMAQLRAMRGWNKQAQGYAIAVLSSLNGAPYPLDKQGVYVWAEGEFKKGAAVSVRYQQAFRQLLDTVDQPHKVKPRLLWAAFAFLRALLSMLLALVAPELEQQPLERPEPVDSPVIALSTWVRLYTQLQLKRLFEWLSRNYRPPKRKETYTERWLRKLTTRVTPWQADEDRLLDRGTGEVVDFSVQMTFDKLLEPAPTPGGPAPDPLLDWLTGELGGSISEVEWLRAA